MKKFIVEESEAKRILSMHRVIKEQAANVDGDVEEIMKELDRFNSDEQKIVDIIKKYNNRSLFQNLLSKYETISGKDFGDELARAIKYPGDAKEYMDLKNHLKTFGITLDQTVGSSGRGRLTFDGVSKTSAPVKTDGTKTGVTIPPELKDVKAFQDWLDDNAKGWATGYTDGIVNKGQNGRGYGTFGPRTQKAWATYKDQYLKGDTAAETPKLETPKPTPEVGGEEITIDITNTDF